MTQSIAHRSRLRVKQAARRPRDLDAIAERRVIREERGKTRK